MQKIPRHYLPCALILCAISGILYAFALPPRGFSLLGWVALVPLLLATRIERPVVVVLGGLIAGLVCGKICGGHWTEAYQYGNLVAAFGAMGMVLGFVAALASVGSGRLNLALWPFYVACAGVTAELLSLHLFPIYLAISQFKNPAALHLASVTGIWGVSFLLWLCSAGIVVAFMRIKAAIPALAVCLLVLAGAWFVPVHRGEEISVAAVQGEDMAGVLVQTKKLSGQAKLIAWPELLFSPASTKIPEAAKAQGSYIAADVAEPNPADPAKPFNTVYLFAPSGERTAAFRKTHLFGRERFSATPGAASAPVRVDGISVGAPICFDAEYTDICRGYARRGAEVLLIPNHDPYMPNGILNYLHLAAVAFRAAENNVPIAWSEACSLSSIIDCDGRIIAQAPLNTETAALGKVHLRAGSTIYNRIGDTFVYLCALAFVAILVSSIRTRPASSLPRPSANLL